ncbi:hypothetical protein ANN_03362 [Periplaneta americana]|uniref:Uncharacterized protein n=1 Tax=Periplaneta americana TaxID=6978 RepID=A0ABQ8TYR5_PERAM|nr:hypothetical protein ANN_03362 [Periplaneta americana]
MIAIQPPSSFVHIPLQCDVIDVHRPGEIRNTLNKKCNAVHAVKPEKVLLPPLHIKFGLMNNFVKAMDKRGEGFAYYVRNMFPKLSEAKVKEGIFVGPQIRKRLKDENFEELEAWNAYGSVVSGFLGKSFAPVTSCCQKKCFSEFTADEQEDLFEIFYSGQTKLLQDATVASCLSRKKISSSHKVTENPKSHYCQHKSNFEYFDNPDLNIKILFELFCDYYKEKTGDKLSMKYKTYFKYFKKNCNVHFRKSKTDVCDFCTSCERKIAENPNDPCQVEYIQHKQKVDKYFALKSKIITKCKLDPSCLVVEFDYAQNFSVLKLNVCAQFYKRLLWLHVFNIHIHNDGSSFLYSFMETQAKKDPNSVASFVHNCLLKKLHDQSQIKNIVLFSDFCGGQNKNMDIVLFCMWFPKVFHVDIRHIFPVRGHSFSQCDRNFGLIESKTRNL